MLKLLKYYEPDLNYVRFNFLHYGGFLYPFRREDNGLPSWWNAYNKIKHEEINNVEYGNFRNTLVGLSALAFIKIGIGKTRELQIFNSPNYSDWTPHDKYHTEFFDYIQFYPKDDE